MLGNSVGAGRQIIGTGSGTPSGGGELSLPRIDWEGGSDYWTVAQEGSKMTKAEAAGWSDPSFFPICVFLGEPSNAAAYGALGINTYMTANHTPPITDITNQGLFVIANYTVTAPDGEVDTGWSTAEIGSNPNVVGWFIYDEAEQGEGVYWNLDVAGPTEDSSTEARRLEFFQSETTAKRNLADGRFMFANWGNGVMGSFWAPTTMDDFVQTVDASCVDKYAYTSPGVRGLFADAPNWTGGSATRRSAAYGWFADQLFRVYGLSAQPAWVFLETKMPLLNEASREIIRYEEIRGAVWSAIANEARGIAYFDHNGNYTSPPADNNFSGNDPNTGIAPDTDSPALLNAEAALATYVQALNEQVLSLAPVLNTQSYVFNFGASGIKTMLKAKDGYAYIFASVGIGGTTGSKTFTVTGSGITGTSVEVVDESRSLTISGGSFTDSFAQEYSHHIYKVAI